MKKVLIVEDEEDLCHLLASQIASDSTEVDKAHSAEDGLELIGKNSYDLVLTDIRLPGMDGVEMMKKIRGEQGEHAPTFFVMSGYSDYSEEEILSSGGKDFFSKPSDIARLFEVVSGYLNS